MNDRELANAVIAQGVGIYLLVGHPMQPDHQYEIGGQALPPYDFVRDWRVAGSLMEKCWDVSADPVGDEKAKWVAHAERPSKPQFYGRGQNNSLPRAFTEACVEALATADDRHDS